MGEPETWAKHIHQGAVSKKPMFLTASSLDPSGPSLKRGPEVSFGGFTVVFHCFKSLKSFSRTDSKFWLSSMVLLFLSPYEMNNLVRDSTLPADQRSDK